MITLTRSLARQLRAVFRRLCPTRGIKPPVVALRTGGDGLRVRVVLDEAAAEFHQPGALPEEVLTVPLEALADCEGRGDLPVSLRATGTGSVEVRWEEGGIPQIREYKVGETPAFPAAPANGVSNPPGLLKALEDAVQCAATDVTRYALNRLQLRGQTGEIVATDGRQLLIQRGFTFPWPSDVLVPALPAFSCKELPRDMPVEVALTESFVCLHLGAWTLFLRSDTEGRYPRAEDVVPKTTTDVTRWQLQAEDAVFLARTLAHLPGNEVENHPLTVDLGEQVCIRARGEGQPHVTELVLARSTFTGKPVRCCLNRDVLARILRLGLGEVVIRRPEVPLVAEDATRTLVCMPLDARAALAPTTDAVRIRSDGEQPHEVPPTERRKKVGPTPESNGNGDANGSASGHGQPRRHAESEPSGQDHAGIGSLIAEADSMKDALRDAYGRASRLVAALKRHRRQSRLLASTVSALRQLQQIDA